MKNVNKLRSLYFVGGIFSHKPIFTIHTYVRSLTKQIIHIIPSLIMHEQVQVHVHIYD